ncbi:MAG: class I SAM-dependent methyltransferase [Candidatus Dormibacteraeota bacterium]|uniref:Class I SAM-dependent methyltransferase n=1 Tax=Candidatus Amunia macphersoniae TaxID=3127014 RepID=A0A934KB40_9BACT|nr:class I SAM-dependent methyltransferase [Candidatus Dormibacteraeota bacterium]
MTTRPSDVAADTGSDSERARRQGGLSFDRVAREYDRRRPGYPSELVAHACATAGLEAGDRVLEIGCGTGQLTCALVERGLRVTAIEPGANLIALADERCRGAGEVTFVHARFEDAPLPAMPVAAVFAAASFHWVDPEVSWSRTAAALAPGGTLALLGYCDVVEERSQQDQAALQAALARCTPASAAAWPPQREFDAIRAGVAQRRGNVSEAWSWIGGHDLARADAAALFTDVELTAVPTLQEHSAAELNALVSTLSFYQQLAPERQEALCAEHVALEGALGRPIRSSIAMLLVTARRG